MRSLRGTAVTSHITAKVVKVTLISSRISWTMREMTMEPVFEIERGPCAPLPVKFPFLGSSSSSPKRVQQRRAPLL